ncbi:MAG: EF-P beta-lysylation protein EpmB [Endozoicomonas sp.]
MITRSELSVQTINPFTCWQEQLVRAITSPEHLLDILQLNRKLLPPALKANQAFALKVPHSFVARMEPRNPKDPLLKQVLPIGEECIDVEGYGIDPLAEQSQNPTDGVIHKYHGRLLLIVSGTCAINCRFCFRRHFPYQDNLLGGESWQKALEYIRSDTSIREVIFSGGDPLAANDKRLGKMVRELSSISHVETLRIHTRLPVVIPQRITETMLDWFTGHRLKPVMVIHCNHAREVNDELRQVMHTLRNAGVTLLNQTVLLREINDNSHALADLSHKLFDAGVLPYYLHLLDHVHGAAHFDVSEAHAKSLVEDVKASCPGYLIPRLVREIPGKPGKTWVQ